MQQRDGRRKTRKVGCALALVSTMLAACSGGSTGDDPQADAPTNSAAASSEDTTPDSDSAARAAEILALPEAERNEAIAALGMESELTAAAESGLEAELGGTDATRDALLIAWEPIVAEAMAIPAGTEPDGFRRVTAPEPPSLGEGLFGGVIVTWFGAEIAGEAARDATTDRPVASSKDGLTVSGTPNHGELTFDKTNVDETTGVTTTLTSKVTMQPCPDTDGHFEGSAVVDVHVSKGSVSQSAHIEVKVSGLVDDNAHLASSELTGNTAWTNAAGVKLGSASGDVLLEHMLGYSLLDGAAKSWATGKCVRIDVTGAGTVKRGAVVDVIAAPRSVIDGGPTGGKVTATFSGQLSAEPMNTPLDADASFVYTAPSDNLPSEGTLTFESRSRRGIGKGKAVMRVPMIEYVISGTGPEIVFTGTADDSDLGNVMYATGTFPDGTAEFTFVADTDADGNATPGTGTVTITGSGNGVTMDGSGTYTLAVNPDGSYTLVMQERSCVHVPGPLPQEICRSHENVTLTLTPTT